MGGLPDTVRPRIAAVCGRFMWGNGSTAGAKLRADRGLQRVQVPVGVIRQHDKWFVVALDVRGVAGL